MTLSVGLFTYSTQPRGSVVHAAHLAEALTRAGVDTTLYALDKDGRGFFRSITAKLVLVPASPPPSSTAELVRLRRQELSTFLGERATMHDVYHAEDCLTASGLLDVKAAGAAIRVTRTAHHVERFQDPYLAECQRRSIVEADDCFAVSRAAAEDVAKAFGVAAPVVTNGVDASRFDGVDASRIRELRDRFGLGDGRVILGVGGVEERKNTLRVLQAFARVEASVPGVRYVIMGGATVLDHGAYRARFEAEKARLPESVRNAVVETGMVSETDAVTFFRMAAVLALPSLHEGFGLAALEGLACGVPVVASRIAPFTEYLDDDCAELVDPHSVASIHDGLEQALHATAARIANGRRRALGYSWTASAREHVRLYERRLPERPSARSNITTTPMVDSRI